MRNDDLRAELERRIEPWIPAWSAAWGLPDLGRQLTFVPSPRLRRSLGRCLPSTGEIRLQPALLDEPEALLAEVACHEAAHRAAYLLHGPRIRPHGPEWARLMRAAGHDPTARLDPARLSESLRRRTRPRARYRYRCERCDAERPAARRMPGWRCARCVRDGRSGRLTETALRP